MLERQDRECYLAQVNELDRNNNNVFNGKNVGDGSQVSSFYTLK